VASDQATSAWPSRVLITNDDGTWRGTFAVRGVRDADGDWAALQRGEIVVTPMRVGEMQPLDRYRGMLAAAPRPVGDGR
jgi:broad specificity polyphosphatase/5'/3'-nucleotidase SurE